MPQRVTAPPSVDASVAMPSPLPIVRDAAGVVVIDKPSGLPSTGLSLDDPDCAQWQLERTRRRRVWAAHQLDADTSGLNVFVERRSLVPVWQERLRWPNATKTYLAIVHGTPGSDHFSVDAPIGPLDSTGRRLGVSSRGRVAQTDFAVLARSGAFALLTAVLRTGRTHQVRIHLAHAGHPLVGEEWYRDPPCALHGRQALHAWRLDFADALEPTALRAPLAPDLVALAERLGLTPPT